MAPDSLQTKIHLTGETTDWTTGTREKLTRETSRVPEQLFFQFIGKDAVTLLFTTVASGLH